jgi:membrane fusion protein, multidrug efflux system
MTAVPAENPHHLPAHRRQVLRRYRWRKFVRWFKRHPIVGLLATLVAAYFAYELVSRTIVYSRDGYVTSDIVFIAPQVAGPVAKLPLVDNQAVAAGQTLLQIDRQPFALAVDTMQADLGVANANLKKAHDEILVATNEINSAQATLIDAQKDKDRVSQLTRSGTDTAQQADTAEKKYAVALAALQRAQNNKIVAEQEQTVQQATIAKAQAALAQSQYDLKQTEILAPVAGRVAPLKIRIGQYVAVGTPAIALVADNRWRVVINLPERHLAGLKAGHVVLFSVSSDHWMNFHWGTVRSISPGVSRSADSTGTLPYVDPTTDWVRLPRRFPVEIDMGTLPERIPLYQGADASMWLLKSPWP